MPQPDIHRSARKHYAKDHLDDEDLRHAYGHVLNPRRWMIWTVRRRAAQTSEGRSSLAGTVVLSTFAERYDEHDRHNSHFGLRWSS